MNRVTLVLWDEAEGSQRADTLRASGGFDVVVHSDRRANPRALRDDPPDVFLIDLGRSPSQGRELGGWLRRQKATRYVPIVFAVGDSEKTQRVRDLLPDATFASWEKMPSAVAEAIDAAPTEPIVPGAMDAYSGSSLSKKLSIHEGTSLMLIDSPEGFEVPKEARPKEIQRIEEAVPAEAAPDVILLFARGQADLEHRFPMAAEVMADGGRLWLCWPKRASGVDSDLTQKRVRAFGLERGFVDYKISSIDATWSGLCFARRSRTGKEAG